MECYPPCESCSGLCKREAPTKTPVRGVSASKPKPGYILMTCLHYTTPEDQVLLRPHRPRDKKKVWCDECSKWQLPITINQTLVEPSEPMF